MRVICVLHANPGFRTIAVDRKITDQYLGYLHSEKPKTEELAKLLLDLEEINLVKEVSIKGYEVSFGVVEAFEDSSEDWERVIREAVEALTIYFELSTGDIVFSIKDNRYKYKDMHVSE